MDVGDWLRSLGLAQYEKSFRENAIDAEVLPDLTDADLEKLGVLLGHRKRVLKEIVSLKGVAGEPIQGQLAAKAEPKAHDAAERRQLTVIFCDLVGSTAMSSALDPEDVRGVISAYHSCCATVITSNGGFVAKYMGDGMLAYFGYPQAHEHDAERAVKAGLTIVDAVTKLDTAAAEPLHVRVGIATGIVVVGGLLGSGEAQERGIVGDTPNLAARLQRIAEPDSVVIADSTRKLLGDLFELMDLGAQDLKGIAKPPRAWIALRPSSQESRFEALHTGELTALVGREEELEVLLRRWAKVEAGEGQVVLISGEAGIGKSRLMAAFLERLVDEPHARLRYFCSPQHTESALYPIIRHLERAARFSREDDAKAQLDKLEALVGATSTSREDTALLAELLSLPNDGRYPALEPAPKQRRQKTLEALIGQIEALARQTPVLMIFEDAHWADPSSLELFGRLGDKIDSQRVLVLATYRPEFAAPWIGRPHVTALTINPLPPRDVLALIEQVAAKRLLPAGIQQDIVERADGIPLFVEEMTKAVLEAESEGAALHTVAVVPSPALPVPASLHASLMARLDRLGSAKRVAQIGAAIGREFSYGLLALVAGESEPELASALDRLTQAGLLFRQGAPPHAIYLFKHVLVQVAAYGTLLREHRRALHGRIAEAFETQFADMVARQPELLAHHCTEAGLIEKAATLWGVAGQQSLARSALVEAEAQLGRALTQTATLAETPALRRKQINFQIGLVNAQMQTKGYAARDTRASLEQARTLIERAEALGEPAEDHLVLFSVLYGFWLTNLVAFNGDALRELASEFLTIAKKQNVTAPLMIGHRLVGTSSLLTGKVPEGRAHLDRAIALYVPDEHRSLATRFASDVRVNILASRSLALCILGHRDAARADADYALRDAREFGHAPTIMVALFWGSLTHIQSGNYACANAQLGELVVLADEKGTPFWRTLGRSAQGCVLALGGESWNAIASIASSIAAYRSTGSSHWIPLCLSSLAWTYAQIDHFDDARRCIHEAMAAVETTGERWNEADIHRIAGEIELLSPERDTAKAQGYFERALEIARAQQTHSWELRAATSLVRLWRDQGRRAPARDLLAPIYGWFTEGFGTADVKDAKALLEELA
jgi:class 3 adenylate cyclase/predicted ATPase